MGATVTCAKHVCALQTASDEILYVLFEQTYEKNVHPHIPHWSATGFGAIADVMDRIFYHASACEGGMLQARHGRITPEGYIDGWLKELAAPRELTYTSIAINPRDIEEVWNKERDLVAETCAFLSDAGHAARAEPLRCGNTVTFDLVQDGLIAARLINALRLPAWKFFTTPFGFAELAPCAALAYAPAKGKPHAVAIPEFRRLDEDRVLRLKQPGRWEYVGWRYRVVGDLIQTLADAELAAPGSHRRCIRQFREAVERAPIVDPATCRIEVAAPGPDAEKRDVDRYDRFVQEHSVTKTATGFTLALDAKTAADVEYNLAAAGVTWIVPNHASCGTNQQDDI
jgi:hypothetical protein